MRSPIPPATTRRETALGSEITSWVAPDRTPAIGSGTQTNPAAIPLRRTCRLAGSDGNVPGFEEGCARLGKWLWLWEELTVVD
jgi:hypothetical protein